MYSELSSDLRKTKSTGYLEPYFWPTLPCALVSLSAPWKGIGLEDHLEALCHGASGTRRAVPFRQLWTVRP